jgi:hypothetical protein
MAADSAAKAAGIYVVVRVEHKRGIETVGMTIVSKYQLDRNRPAGHFDLELIRVPTVRYSYLFVDPYSPPDIIRL